MTKLYILNDKSLIDFSIIKLSTTQIQSKELIELTDIKRSINLSILTDIKEKITNNLK